MLTKTITDIPVKKRKPAPAPVAENYALHNFDEAASYTRMCRNQFRKISIANNCLPIVIGNKFYYKLSALNQLLDSLSLLKN